MIKWKRYLFLFLGFNWSENVNQWPIFQKVCQVTNNEIGHNVYLNRYTNTVSEHGSRVSDRERGSVRFNGTKRALCKSLPCLYEPLNTANHTLRSHTITDWRSCFIYFFLSILYEIMRSNWIKIVRITLLHPTILFFPIFLILLFGRWVLQTDLLQGFPELV